MIFFIGLTYAELTAAMPQCGGEHVFSHRAMGPVGSFICTWAIVLGYVSVVCFEACALPTIITYIYPVLQTVLTVIIGGVGILLIVASVVTGDTSNLDGQLFVGGDKLTSFKAVIAVAVTTPFFFIGFDVIPQAAEEINVPLKKIGTMMLFSIVMAVTFYALVILAVGYVLNHTEIENAMSGSGLVTADAMAKAFNSSVMSKVLIVGRPPDAGMDQ